MPNILLHALQEEINRNSRSVFERLFSSLKSKMSNRNFILS